MKRLWLVAIIFLLTCSGVLFYLLLHQSHSTVVPSILNPSLCSSLGATMPETTACPTRILIFSKTAGFRHDSIPSAISALKLLASQHHLQADSTEDSSLFTPENLAHYRAVLFLMTSGHILDPSQQQAFEHYIHSGGGYLGIHSASDTEYAWPWYGQLVGAYFKNHPPISSANLTTVDPNNLSTNMLPTLWTRTDEWYNFRTNPRPSVHVLLTVDETSYTGGSMGSDHPISWFHDFEGGRSFYTAMGHSSSSYLEPLFLDHLWGGILYAAKLST